MIRHVDVTMDQVWGWLSCLQGLCQQKSEGVDRPQWSAFSHVNYSGSLSSTFGSKATHCKVDSRRNMLLTVSCNAEDMLLPRGNFTFSGK
ncbi:hypothetical protein JHK85_053440 [Glycine max]|nr:hypothetical protein JHK85_053440 [Glycine max]